MTVNEFVARTKKSREKGLEPTKPELIAYARYLGIDTVIDGDLMWIAEEALNAPLPSEWTEHNDSADRIFYYNVHTHKSSWTHPLEQLHRDLYKSIVNFRSGELTKEQQSIELDKLRHKCEGAEREAHQELQLWTEHTDEQSQKFFYNREQHMSVWTDPRPAMCHSLYLQIKALRVLGKHCGQSVSMNGLEPLLAEKNRIASERDAHSNRVNTRQSASNTKSADNVLNADDSGDCTEPRRRKKRHKDPEANSKEHATSQVTNDEQGTNPLKKSGLDLKKTSMPLEEARGGLSMPQSLQTHAMSGSLQSHAMTGSLHGTGRIPSPLGDGLSTVGRVKVKAGIRLEPLRA